MLVIFIPIIELLPPSAAIIQNRLTSIFRGYRDGYRLGSDLLHLWSVSELKGAMDRGEVVRKNWQKLLEIKWEQCIEWIWSRTCNEVNETRCFRFAGKWVSTISTWFCGHFPETQKKRTCRGFEASNAIQKDPVDDMSRDF